MTIKRAYNRKRLIALMAAAACAASLMLLGACAGVRTGLAAETPNQEPEPSAAAPEPGGAVEPPAPSGAERSACSVTWTAAGGKDQCLSVGRQEGEYPWGRAFPVTGGIRKQEIQGGMPGVVSHKVDGDRFKIWFGHNEETGCDEVRRFQTTNPDFKTPAGVGHGSTAAELFKAYPENLLYQPEPLPVPQDLGGDFCTYDFLLAYAGDGGCIIFYMQEAAGGNIVRGMALTCSSGGELFSADGETTFAVDAALAQELIKPDISDETAIYGLLAVDKAGVAEKKDILARLPGLNWTVYAGLYGGEAFDLMTWLFSQPFTDEDDIFCLLGASAGLDGAYAEGYASVVAGIFDRDPEKLVRQMARLSDKRLCRVADLLAYGLSYFDSGPVKAELEALSENGGLPDRARDAARAVLEAVVRNEENTQ